MPSNDQAQTHNVTVKSGEQELPGLLTMPLEQRGIVLFVHGSSSSRLSPRNQYVADVLQREGFGTLLFDLLTDVESRDRNLVFDIALLTERLIGATEWIASSPGLAGARIGYFGASTGAAAALVAAAQVPTRVQAVVSRGGRPDLADGSLERVQAPTLLIVGARDPVVLDLNREAQHRLGGQANLAVVPGATHLFEEPGALEAAARLAADWFAPRLTRS